VNVRATDRQAALRLLVIQHVGHRIAQLQRWDKRSWSIGQIELSQAVGTAMTVLDESWTIGVYCVAPQD
jgi:hypothetical protein